MTPEQQKLVADEAARVEAQGLSRAAAAFRLPDFAVVVEREAASLAALEADKAAAALEARRKRIHESRPAIAAADVDRIIADDMADTKSLGVVRRWLKTAGKPFLLLTGTVGVGKTVAASWALAQRDGEYMRAPAMVGIFAAYFGAEVEEKKRLCRVPLLVVDEIGTERDAERMQSTLFEIIDERRWHGQRTIFVSNLSGKDFDERYHDQRLQSRWKECAIVVNDASDDLRGKP